MHGIIEEEEMEDEGSDEEVEVDESADRWDPLSETQTILLTPEQEDIRMKNKEQKRTATTSYFKSNYTFWDHTGFWGFGVLGFWGKGLGFRV
jgi:hypothetical protein